MKAAHAFVVYRDHDGWFHWTVDEAWDRPTYKLDGQRVDTRVEIGRYDTKTEARAVRDLYNQMVHGKPSTSDSYNQMLKEVFK